MLVFQRSEHLLYLDAKQLNKKLMKIVQYYDLGRGSVKKSLGFLDEMFPDLSVLPQQ